MKRHTFAVAGCLLAAATLTLGCEMSDDTSGYALDTNRDHEMAQKEDMAQGSVVAQRGEWDQNRSQTQAQTRNAADGQQNQPFQDIKHAVAVMHGRQNGDVHGVVNFYQEGSRVRVRARIEGLEPGSVHAIHVHEYGDCTASDLTSAGGHYNPQGNSHNLPKKTPRHAGDLGNLTEANDQGVAMKEITVRNISIAGQTAPILGRGVIVHAGRDTGKGKSGEAGKRIACGVIGIAQEKSGLFE